MAECDYRKRLGNTFDEALRFGRQVTPKLVCNPMYNLIDFLQHKSPNFHFLGIILANGPIISRNTPPAARWPPGCRSDLVTWRLTPILTQSNPHFRSTSASVNGSTGLECGHKLAA